MGIIDTPTPERGPSRLEQTVGIGVDDIQRFALAHGNDPRYVNIPAGRYRMKSSVGYGREGDQRFA